MVDTGDPLGAGIAKHGSVQAAVVVVVAPGSRAGRDRRQAGPNIGKQAAAHASVDCGNAPGQGPAISGDEDVGTAVVVIVAPDRSAVAHRHQPGHNRTKKPTGIGVEQGKRLAGAAVAGQEKIEVAVIVVVSPGNRAPVQGR